MEGNEKILNRKKKSKLLGLSDYKDSYDIDKFILDLLAYFDNEVDFDLSKIRAIVEEKGKLNQLIAKAGQNNTHPVTEFVQELFKDIYEKRV